MKSKHTQNNEIKKITKGHDILTITNIQINKLHPVEGHPFKVRDDEEMNSLIESIQTQGIVEPLLIRPLENTVDEYEVISGHRRLRAAQKAGLTEVPAFIHSIKWDEAAILLVDCNLHCGQLLPSEKAFAYKLKYDALKRQGFRSDLTSGQIVPKLGENRTGDLVGAEAGDSYKTVQRYIRLTHLIPPLLDMMDEGKIAFSVGVELSYLPENLQRSLLSDMEALDCTPSYAQAVRLHKEHSAGQLREERIGELLSEPKPNQKETLKLPLERLRQFAPRATDRQLEEFIFRACEYYQRYLKRQRDRDAR